MYGQTEQRQMPVREVTYTCVRVHNYNLQRYKDRCIITSTSISSRENNVLRFVPAGPIALLWRGYIASLDLGAKT